VASVAYEATLVFAPIAHVLEAPGVPDLNVIPVKAVFCLVHDLLDVNVDFETDAGVDVDTAAAAAADADADVDINVEMSRIANRIGTFELVTLGVIANGRTCTPASSSRTFGLISFRFRYRLLVPPRCDVNYVGVACSMYVLPISMLNY
jgi:hypothetical protein